MSKHTAEDTQQRPELRHTDYSGRSIHITLGWTLNSSTIHLQIKFHPAMEIQTMLAIANHPSVNQHWRFQNMTRFCWKYQPIDSTHWFDIWKSHQVFYTLVAVLGAGLWGIHHVDSKECHIQLPHLLSILLNNPLELHLDQV